MNIYAKRGDKVVFANPDVGYEADRRQATLLTLGASYTVDYTVVGGFNTRVYLQEFPGIYFNSVLFEDGPASIAGTCGACKG